MSKIQIQQISSNKWMALADDGTVLCVEKSEALAKSCGEARYEAMKSTSKSES